jgi:hypothetical protein
MKAVGKSLALLGALAAIPLASLAAPHYDADNSEIYRAPNVHGLAGLLTMNIPHTMGAGATLVASAAYEGAEPGLYESAMVTMGALRIGLSENVEFAVKGKLYQVDPTIGESETGLGDAEAMIKWKFRNQNENLPAMAFGLGAILPTAEESKGFQEVENWGGKFMIAASAEMSVFEDSYIGLYAEAQAVVIDSVGNNTAYTDKYGIINLGIAFPISDNNALVFFVEHNQIVKKNTGLYLEQDYTAITPGLRLATDNFNLTVGLQDVQSDNPIATDSRQRAIATLSMGF